MPSMSSPAPSPPPRLISDELWALFEPLIPPQRPAVHGRTGRPRTSDRDVLEGIAFVLSNGIGWTKLPRELGYGSGWTCWRRMREWADAGVFDQVHQAVLDRLGEQGELDWSRACLDSVSVRAKGGCADRPQPDRPEQGRQPVPPAGRRARTAAQRAGLRGQPARQPIRRADPRRHAGDQARRSRAPAPPTGQAARGQGLRQPAVRRYLRRRGITARIARRRRLKGTVYRARRHAVAAALLAAAVKSRASRWSSRSLVIDTRQPLTLRLPADSGPT
jgi:transposase